jgi:hypothetical protein
MKEGMLNLVFTSTARAADNSRANFKIERVSSMDENEGENNNNNNNKRIIKGKTDRFQTTTSASCSRNSDWALFVLVRLTERKLLLKLERI